MNSKLPHTQFEMLLLLARGRHPRLLERMAMKTEDEVKRWEQVALLQTALNVYDNQTMPRRIRNLLTWVRNVHRGNKTMSCKGQLVQLSSRR